MTRLDTKVGYGGTCDNCGRPAHEHFKEKVFYGGGRWGYNYHCPQ